jgi:hypothetical protein
MVSLDRYHAYRTAAKALNQQIMDALVDRAALMGAARGLDIARGDTIVFESEAEMNVLMDYALYESRVHGQSLVQGCREQTALLSPMQRALLDAMCQSYTSLFRIADIGRDDHTNMLVDVLDQRKQTPLVDILFSRTAEPGMLLFSRVVPLAEMNMTAGIAFVFTGRPAGLPGAALQAGEQAGKSPHRVGAAVSRILSLESDRWHRRAVCVNRAQGARARPRPISQIHQPHASTVVYVPRVLGSFTGYA